MLLSEDSRSGSGSGLGWVIMASAAEEEFEVGEARGWRLKEEEEKGHGIVCVGGWVLGVFVEEEKLMMR